MKVHEAIAEALIAEGIDSVFGVMGDGNMAAWASIVDRGIALRSARHEAAAVSMADGYARVRANVGVATVTCGPGLTHAATPIVAAARHRTPLVLIVGDTLVLDRASPQRFDHQRFAAACEAEFVDIAAGSEAAARIRLAFQLARTRRGPVVLNAPMDVFEQDLPEGTAITASAVAAASVPPPRPQDVDALAGALVNAERPVLVAGRGAMGPGASDAIAALADRAGALLGTSLLARNLFNGHAFDIGVIGGFASDAAETLLRGADVVIGFGTTLAGHVDARSTPMLSGARVFRVESDANAGPGPCPATIMVADAAAMASAVEARLPGGGRKGGIGASIVSRLKGTPRLRGYRSAQTQALLSAPPDLRAPPADGLDPRRLMAALSPALPEGVQITCGVGHFWGFPVMRLALPAGARMEFTYPFGAIGSGLPLAIGVAASCPERPQLLIEGDGSLLQHLQELETVVREGLPLTVLVMNDAGYGAEIYKLGGKGLDPALAKWVSPDFVAVAKALGGDGVVLQSEAEVADALREGLAHDGLFVIDARISPSTPNDRYEKMLGLR